METIANYLGNYKREVGGQYSSGPIIISSNYYYAWGDLLTFRHIGERVLTHSDSLLTSHESAPLHQPIGEYFPADVESAPIHLRYHTISEENPVTIIQTIGEEASDAIIVLKSTAWLHQLGYNLKYIEIEDHSDKDICLEVFINMVESSEQPIESWVLTKERKFLLSMEPLLMFVAKAKTNPLSVMVMIIEASPLLDQNLPNPSSASLETFVQHFVDQAIESAVAEHVQQVVDVALTNN